MEIDRSESVIYIYRERERENFRQETKEREKILLPKAARMKFFLHRRQNLPFLIAYDQKNIEKYVEYTKF